VGRQWDRRAPISSRRLPLRPDRLCLPDLGAGQEHLEVGEVDAVLPRELLLRPGRAKEPGGVETVNSGLKARAREPHSRRLSPAPKRERARARVKGQGWPCARGRASGTVGGRMGRVRAKGTLTVLSVPHPVRVRGGDGEQAGGHELDRQAALRNGQSLRLLGGITIRLRTPRHSRGAW
jgi:hypothetical protein